MANKTPSMEDILSSIRTTVQAETGRTVGEGEDLTWVEDDAGDTAATSIVALSVEHAEEPETTAPATAVIEPRWVQPKNFTNCAAKNTSAI